MPFKKGHKPWNTGLTKEVDVRLKNISDLRKQRVTSPNTRKKLSEIFSGKNNPFYGKKHSEECIKRMSKLAIERFKNPKNNPMYGKKHSEETKKKIGEKTKGRVSSMKDKKHTKESKKKMSEASKGQVAWNKGRKWSKEVIIKISESHKGKKLTEEHKRKIFLSAPRGDGHYNWKGGIACGQYCDVWLDKEYKESIKERDGYQCLNPECSGQHTRLHLHHINYNKKDCRQNNLITICVSCNTKANYNRDWHQSWYQAIINKRYKI